MSESLARNEDPRRDKNRILWMTSRWDLTWKNMYIAWLRLIYEIRISRSDVKKEVVYTVNWKIPPHIYGCSQRRVAVCFLAAKENNNSTFFMKLLMEFVKNLYHANGIVFGQHIQESFHLDSICLFWHSNTERVFLLPSAHLVLFELETLSINGFCWSCAGQKGLYSGGIHAEIVHTTILFVVY